MAAKESTALPASGIAAVLAVLIGFVLVHETSLDKSRPGARDKSGYRLIDLQDAEARLWQDPFAAVHAHQDALDQQLNDHKKRETAPAENKRASTPVTGSETRTAATEDPEAHLKRHGLASLATEIRKAGPHQLKTVLAVTVEGGPYAEDAEQRRRFRYATLAGLNQLGFAPEDGAHIGYVIPRVGGDAGGCAHTLPERIPFEWFIPKRRTVIEGPPDDSVGSADKNGSASSGRKAPNVPTERALVLWLNEHALTKLPSETLRELTRCLGMPETLTLKVIGPASSDTLHTLINQEKAAPIKTPGGKKTGPRIEFYSAIATASESLVGQLAVCMQTPGELCGVRTTSTDDMLARDIISELKERGVDLTGECPSTEHTNGKCPKVALISEWDTLYGQSLPNAIQTAICKETNCPSVFRYSYLQGLDGAGAGASQTVTSSAARHDAKGQTREAARAEHADGSQQFDYLRRLADSLKQRNAALKDSGQEIRAIGILGSDAYDKLLVLKALRGDFPRAVFFTTDLDARLLHPDEFAWVRNIVVASSFGLTLRAELQGEIPPFRESYQTALFLSTFLALSDDAHKYEQQNIASLIAPRLFEIGRRSAFGLNQIETSPAKDRCAPNDLLNCGTVHPPSPPLVPKWIQGGWSFVLPVAFALLLLAFLYLPRIGRRLTREPVGDQAAETIRPGGINVATAEMSALDAARARIDRARLWSITGSVIVALLVLLLLHAYIVGGLSDVSRNTEPVRFYEGISVWPAELLRLAAALLSIFFIVWATLNLKKNQLELTQWFFPGWKEDLPVVRWRGSLLRILGCDLLRGQNPKAKSIDPHKFWAECVYHGLPVPRMVRALVPAALFFALAYCLFAFADVPIPPTRGQHSESVDKVMVFASVWLFLVLTFFVVDATLLCRRFIGALSERHTEWPPETHAHFGAFLTVKTAQQSTVADADTHAEAAAASATHAASRSAAPAERGPAIDMTTSGKGHDGAADTAATGAVPEKTYDDWIDMRLIAARTAEVGKLIYYPLAVLLLLLFARSTLFDRWEWPVPLIVIFVTSFAVAIGCAIVLRLEAERARKNALDNIAVGLLSAKGGGETGSALASQLEFMHTNIQEMSEGAFAPFTQQPVVKALLLFFSASGLAVLEYFGVLSI